MPSIAGQMLVWPLTLTLPVVGAWPVWLPVAYKPTKEEQSATQKKFHCLLKAPGDTDHYLAAIDQAMEWKLKAGIR